MLASSVSTTAFTGVKVVSKTTARTAKRAVAARAGQYDDELLETAVRVFFVCFCRVVFVVGNRRRVSMRWMTGRRCPRARSSDDARMTMCGCTSTPPMMTPTTMTITRALFSRALCSRARRSGALDRSLARSGRGTTRMSRGVGG